MKIKKKQYMKPQLRTIELKAEEVLNAGCKNTAIVLPGSGPSCLMARCSGNGS